MNSTFTHRWIRKFRILTISLIFSGALNLGALALLISYLVQDRKDALSFTAPQPSRIKLSGEVTNLKLLESYGKLTFRELAALLTNTDFVEEGYRKRDLALSALVSKHHFNLEKALGSMPPQMRVLEADSPYVLFPGLTDDQFQALIRFAYLEKWPLTGEGLFVLLKKNKQPRDETLEQAFRLTPEFYALSVLFQKVEPRDLIDLACDGTWQMLAGFVLEQSQMLDLSEERRRRLLLSYLALQSPTAARLLVKTDFAFTLKSLDDKGISDLLTCVKGLEPALLQTFCVELLKSPRSDGVWRKSAELLYAVSGEAMPEVFDRNLAISHFAKDALIKQLEPPMRLTRPQRRLHTVQDGESLWKIARLYKVKVDEIVLINGLQKETIVPGMLLQIPE